MALLELAFPAHLHRQRTRADSRRSLPGASNQTSGSCPHPPTIRSYRDTPLVLRRVT
jgi:hypothetical protein